MLSAADFTCVKACHDAFAGCTGDAALGRDPIVAQVSCEINLHFV